jgi:hypothetical protein
LEYQCETLEELPIPKDKYVAETLSVSGILRFENSATMLHCSSFIENTSDLNKDHVGKFITEIKSLMNSDVAVDAKHCD